MSPDSAVDEPEPFAHCAIDHRAVDDRTDEVHSFVHDALKLGVDVDRSKCSAALTNLLLTDLHRAMPRTLVRRCARIGHRNDDRQGNQDVHQSHGHGLATIALRT